MEVRPILSALLKNKTRAALIALQVAMTLAIVSNALFIIGQRLEKMNRPTGIAVDELLFVRSLDLRTDSDFFAEVAVDVEGLRAIPGVADVTVIGSALLSGGGNGECFSAVDDPEAPSVCHNRNKIDERGLTTLGLELVAGRDFTRSDVSFEGSGDVGFAPVAIVTQALADELFPEAEALGQTVYSDDWGVSIVGIVERMQGPWLSSDGIEKVMLQPIIREGTYSRYMVRAEAGMRDALVPELEEALREINSERIAVVMTQSDIVARTYSADRAMTKVLATVIVLLIIVSLVGIVGLANASVSQRTKQIGTRRALGARKLDIIRYFMVENGLVTGFGVLLGAILSFAFNYWLVETFELPRLQASYVGYGVLALLILGQLAVLAPARRASAVEPSIATRTV